jgi:hypothetical protein
MVSPLLKLKNYFYLLDLCYVEIMEQMDIFQPKYPSHYSLKFPAIISFAATYSKLQVVAERKLG